MRKLTGLTLLAVLLAAPYALSAPGVGGLEDDLAEVRSMLASGDAEAALLRAQKISGDHPGSTEALYLEARCLETLRRYEQAVVEYERCAILGAKRKASDVVDRCRERIEALERIALPHVKAEAEYLKKLETLKQAAVEAREWELARRLLKSMIRLRPDDKVLAAELLEIASKAPPALQVAATKPCEVVIRFGGYHRFMVYLNGEELGESASFSYGKLYEVPAALRDGDILAARVQSAPNQLQKGGFFLSAVDGTGREVLGTSTWWRVSSRVSGNWKSKGFDDSTWRRARRWEMPEVRAVMDRPAVPVKADLIHGYAESSYFRKVVYLEKASERDRASIPDCPWKGNDLPRVYFGTDSTEAQLFVNGELFLVGHPSRFLVSEYDLRNGDVLAISANVHESHRGIFASVVYPGRHRPIASDRNWWVNERPVDRWKFADCEQSGWKHARSFKNFTVEANLDQLSPRPPGQVIWGADPNRGYFRREVKLK
jgi:tetratricopeptide (TPR) repeat protein